MTDSPAARHGSVKGYGFGALTERIIGAAIEVHKELGPGFQEVVYQRALALELQTASVEAERECKPRCFGISRVQWPQAGCIAKIPKHHAQIDTRRVDFVVEDCIVEIKARSAFLPEDFIQTLSYLKASRFRIALLINFGAEKLEVRRQVNERGRYAPEC